MLGRRLVAELTRRGHEVAALTRDERGDALIRELDGEPHRGDVLDIDSIRTGVEGADVVVNAATKIPTGAKPSEDEWRMSDRVRCVGTRNLVDAAVAADVERFVQQSVVWVARQPDGSRFDETSLPHSDPSTRSERYAERIITDSAVTHQFELVILRGGWFYAPDATHTRTYGEQLLTRKLPIIGGGPLGRRDAILSYLHVDDAARAFVAAIEGDATGTFHVVDDRPSSYASFVRTFADRLDAPSPRRLPAWVAKVAVGDRLLTLLTRSMPTSNEKFRETFDWSPEYPTIQEGIDDVVTRWRETGEIVERARA